MRGRRSLAVAWAAALALALWACGASQGQESAGDAGAADGTTRVSADPLRVGVRVRVAPVRSGIVASTDDLTGVVYAFHKATVNAETEGRVLARRVERGESVDAGAVLFELDASRAALELRRATATVHARETDLAHARRELARGEKLAARNAISEQHRDDLVYAVERAENELALARVARDTAKRTHADATIRAPFSAVVEETSVDVGDFVAPGTPVATLVELSRVRLRAGVTAATTARLHEGQSARARFAALGGADVEAELKSVGLVADPVSGTYPVELWIDNPDGRLREGMVGTITLPAGAGAADGRTPGLLVPRAALVRGEGGLGVYVAQGEGEDARAVARAVRIGHGEGEWVEALEGVREGEWVVVDGQFALRDGAPIVVERTTDVADGS